MEPRLDRGMQVVKHRTPLLTARRDHRPDPLAPAIPCFAPRPLRHQTVEYHEPDRLFRQGVRRLHSRRGNEPEITRPMRLQPLRQLATVLRLRYILCATAHHLGTRRLQLVLKDRG